MDVFLTTRYEQHVLTNTDIKGLVDCKIINAIH